MQQRSRPPESSHQSFVVLPVIMTLAMWQARQTWRLLSLIGLGMGVAVVLVCAVPLYTQVATTTGLRTLLTSSPANSALTIQSSSERPLSSTINAIGQKLHQEIQNDVGPYLSPSSQFSVITHGLSFHTLNPHAYGNEIALTGSSMARATPHVRVVQGRLPASLSSSVEIAVTAQTATHLHLFIGQTITMSVFYQTHTTQGQLERDLPLTIVGIFEPYENDLFWHQTSFADTPLYTPDGRVFTLFNALMSNDTFLSFMDRLSLALASSPVSSSSRGTPLLQNSLDLVWYYSLDVARIDAAHLDNLIQRLNTLLFHVSGNTNSPFVQVPVVEYTGATATVAPLVAYQNRLTVLNVPVSSLELLVTCLILFFISVMMGVLVDRYADTIAVLQSRGANRSQVFGIMLTQSVGLGLLALLLAPVLSVFVVSILAQSVLHESEALNILTSTPFTVLTQTALPLLLVSVAVVLATVPAMLRASEMNVLTQRRETARSIRVPLWLRLNLDIFAAALSLLGYAFARYVTTPGVLNTHIYLLVLSPLIFVGTTFLVLACALLFLRLFPLLLRLVSGVAQRSRSAAFLLGIVQMARTPRPVGRIILLLALALSFGMFTLVFTASQQRRIEDVAAYQVGADFSGTIPTDAPVFPSVEAQTAAYAHIPGVVSATVGYNALALTFGNEEGIPVALRAVDASTFAHTAYWPDQTGKTSLSSLMTLLRSYRGKTVDDGVPAIVDEAASEQLHLQLGLPFLLNDGVGTVKFIPVSIVSSISTVYDSSGSTGDAFTPVGGVLVDYQTYAALFHDTNDSLAPIKTTQVWIRTDGTPTAIARVREALSTGALKLENLNDREAIVEFLTNDPLYQTLRGVLLLGTVAALLLALLGSVVTSWLNARLQLTHFVLLRALGSSPRQWRQILFCEQGVVYLAAIGQGVLYGLILSLLALPTLVFTSVNTPGSSVGSTVSTSSDFYLLQTTPPVRIVIPPSVCLALLIVLAFCLLALWLMIRVVSTPVMSQVLRLNED